MQHRLVNPRRVLAAATMSLAFGLASASAIPGGASTLNRAPAATTFQYGMDTLVLDGCQDGITWNRVATTEAKAFKKLGANTVGITFPMYTDSKTSNNFYGKLSCNPAQDFHTPSTARLAVVIDAAHAAGLKVLLRPFLDQANLINQSIFNWRGNIKPSSPSAWFKNYTNSLLPYLRMAQRHHVEHFAISTELESMATFHNWAAVITTARHVYRGNLVFTFSWVKNKSEVRPNFTTPGMDTYPSLPSLSNSSTPGQVLAAWNAHLTSTDPLPWISKVADDEVGIPAQNNAYKEPYANYFPLSSNPFNQTIQANWFTAACAFAKQHKMKGIYFWGSILTDHGGALLSAPNPSATGEIQPLSQKAIRACF